MTQPLCYGDHVSICFYGVAAGPQMQTLACPGISGPRRAHRLHVEPLVAPQHPAPVFGGDADSGIKDPTSSPLRMECAGWLRGRAHSAAPLHGVRRDKKNALEAQEALEATLFNPTEEKHGPRQF